MNKCAKEIGVNQDCPGKNVIYDHPTRKYAFAIISRKGTLYLKVYYCSTNIMIFIKILQSGAVCIISSSCRNPNISSIYRTYRDAEKKTQN